MRPGRQNQGTGPGGAAGLRSAQSPEYARADRLVTEALGALGRGDLRRALRAIDARCRMALPAEAPHFTLRAECLRHLGRAESALADLRRAQHLDPWNAQNAIRLARHGTPAERRRAAIVLLTDPDSVHLETGARTLAALSTAGWVGLTRARHPRVRILLRNEARPRLLVDGETAADAVAEPVWRGETIHLWGLPLPESMGRTPPTISLREPADVLISSGDNDVDSADPRIAAGVAIVVPIYEDAAATEACLRAIYPQVVAEPDAHLILVDDASPNAEIVRRLASLTPHPRVTILRNGRNRGFIGAVNRALACAVGGDVILLNADTIAPPGLIGRLRRTAVAHPRIGTITPLSNNGESTSFPIRDESQPIPGWTSLDALDRIAASVNAGRVIDMPNGIGFCLYITRACLDAVGGLPTDLERGYLEDVEFCLLAARHGLRNVCDPSVFVFHEGTRSFGEEKRGLVIRNLAEIERRHPDYRERFAVFNAKDPLAGARHRIEEALGAGPGPVALLVCGEGLARDVAVDRAKAVPHGAPRPLILSAEGVAGEMRVTLRAADDAPPANLVFRAPLPSVPAELDAYLGTLDIAAVTIRDPAACPPNLVSTLARHLASGRSITVDPVDGGALCPRRYYLDGSGRHCGIPEPLACEACVAGSGAEIGLAGSVADYRTFWRQFGAHNLIGRSAPTLPAGRDTPPTGPAPTNRVRIGPVRIGWLLPSRSIADTVLLREVCAAWLAAGEDVDVIAFGEPFDTAHLDGLENLSLAGAFAPEDWADLLSTYRPDSLVLGTRRTIRTHPMIDLMRQSSLMPAAVRPAPAEDGWFVLDPAWTSDEIACWLLEGIATMPPSAAEKRPVHAKR